MCEACNEARGAPQYSAMFAGWCLHCAARRIQYIQRRLNLAPEATRIRCRKALADALELGLPEADIRRMAKLPEWQLAPLLPASSPARPKSGG